VRSVNASSLLSSSSVTVICADFSFFPKSKDELPPSSPFPLEVGPRNTARDLGERCKLPQRVWDEAPADKRLGAYWGQKVQLWWQQFLLIFLRANVIFYTKQASYRTSGPIPHGPAPYEEFFSLGAVATIALWKSAPMVTTDTRASIGMFELHCAAPTVCSSLLFKKWNCSRPVSNTFECDLK